MNNSLPAQNSVSWRKVGWVLESACGWLKNVLAGEYVQIIWGVGLRVSTKKLSQNPELVLPPVPD